LSAADEYWSVDIPGLTEDQAVSLQERLAGEFECDVVVISPRQLMVRGFPRVVVEKLVSCLRAGLAAGGMSDEDEAGVEALLEDFDAWLDQAEE
jgi:hypothetical protein